MARPRKEIEGIALVAVGAFSPGALTPGWLAAHNLLAREVAESAEVLVVTGDITQFQTDQLLVQVTQERIEITTTQSPYEAARDLMLGALSLSGSPPLKGVGINLRGHYRFKDEEAWHAAGHLIVPQDFWDDFLDDPGMRGIQMQGKRSDGYPGSLNVRMEPSVMVHPGIYVSVNSHFELDPKKPESMDSAVSILTEHFSDDLKSSGALIEGVLDNIAASL